MDTIEEQSASEALTEILNDLGLGEDVHDAFVLYMTEIAGANVLGADSSDVQGFEDSFEGEHKSFLEFATQFVDDVYDLDSMLGNLSAYFDYDAFANDLRYDFTVIETDSYSVLVFRDI